MRSASVIYYFRDNEGNVAQVKLHADPDAAASSGGIGFAEAVAEELQSRSDAALTHYVQVYKYDASPPGGRPAPASNCYRSLLLFFRDAGKGGTLSIPSPSNSLPFDGNGAYRLTRLAPGPVLLSGVLDSLQSVLAPVVFPDGTPFPTGFVVGTLTEVE